MGAQPAISVVILLVIASCILAKHSLVARC